MSNVTPIRPGITAADKEALEAAQRSEQLDVFLAQLREDIIQEGANTWTLLGIDATVEEAFLILIRKRLK